MKPVSIVHINNRGSSLVGSIFFISMMGFFGMSMIQVLSSENTVTVQEMESVQARGALEAGNQRAENLIFYGASPDDVTQFGTATITTTTSPSNGTVTVKAQVGNAIRSNSFTTTFGEQCISIDTSQAAIEDNKLKFITLNKNCDNANVIVDRTKIDWNWSQSCQQGDSPETCLGDHDTHAHASAVITKWGLEGVTLYSAADNIGLPTGFGADPDEWIDGVNANLTGTGSYEFVDPAIEFDKNLPSTLAAKITVEFADGSQITDTFIVDQDVSAPDPGPGVDIVDNHVEIDPNKQVTINVLGTAITYGAGGPDIPVWVDLGTWDDNNNVTYSDLYNNHSVSGNETETMTVGSDGAIFSVKGNAEYGSFHSAYDSATNSVQVLTYMNGDVLPDIPGFDGQDAIVDFCAQYISDDGTIVLADNQVILLFELGTTNLNSSAADFQDLVILMTVEDAPADADSPVDNNDDDNEVIDECSPQGKVTICHFPPGNQSNAHTLCVGASAVQAHVRNHGDYEGPCQEDDGGTYENNLQITIKGK